MSRFDDIMEIVFKWEGGYSDNPRDPGGATKFGITQAVLADWRGVTAVSKQEVKTLTQDDAKEIFRERYFKVIRGDDLPEPIDLIVMDGAVNHGTGTMTRFVQQVVGTAETGRISDADLAAVRATAAKDGGLLALAVALAELRKERYRTRPHAATFILGWTNRLNDVMSVALAGLGARWTFADGLDTGGASGGIEPDPVSSYIRPVIEDDEMQAALASWGDYAGKIDGMFCGESLAATDKALERNQAIIAGNWKDWSLKRKKVALGQLICQDSEIAAGRIDGLFGPRTEQAFLDFNRKRLRMPQDKWRDESEKGEYKPPIVMPSTVWPTQGDLASVFGTACTSGDNKDRCGPGSVKLKRLDLPFTMKIAWDLRKTITGFSINEKVHDSAARVFDRIYQHYGDDGIEDLGINLFGGCYNCRKITGGSSCSTHAWAIAIDFDPARNQYKWSHTSARLAKPDAVRFWEFWEAEGWVSLGRARDHDWMHVQAARL